MFEVYGDLWSLPADVICITTNGYVRKDGAAVMGRGCAKEATRLFPGIEHTLGGLLSREGNHVHHLGETPDGRLLLSFPVKHAWNEKADPVLIARSCEELVEWADIFSTRMPFVALPRPGCGNGQLDWETQVKPICRSALDSRFGVVDFAR